MNQEYKAAIDIFIDEHFQSAKQKIIVHNSLEPEAYYFFHYSKRPDKKFGQFLIPGVPAFFKTRESKQYLASHIQHGYEGYKAMRIAMNGLFDFELIAVILIVDEEVSIKEFASWKEAEKFTSNNTIRPSEDPAKKNAITYHVYFKKDSFTYRYFFTRRTHQACFESKRKEFMQPMEGGPFQNLFPK